MIDTRVSLRVLPSRRLGPLLGSSSSTGGHRAFDRPSRAAPFRAERSSRRFAPVAGGFRPGHNVATDGETFAITSATAKRCIAHALADEAVRRGFWDHQLRRVPGAPSARFESSCQARPQGEGTSWSCAHGVGAGAATAAATPAARTAGTRPGAGPLRDALDFLRDHAAARSSNPPAATSSRTPGRRATRTSRWSSTAAAPAAEFLRQHAPRELASATASGRSPSSSSSATRS
jgi:hypothetical protein